MGMSGDFPIAIEEGATRIRIGTALFGPRSKQVTDQLNRGRAGMIRETADGITLAVRAQPGAKKTAITGVYGEGAAAQLKIAVQAPPIEGRANEALIAFLAGFFALSQELTSCLSRASRRAARSSCSVESTTGSRADTASS